MPMLFDSDSSESNECQSLVMDMCNYRDVDRTPLNIVKGKIWKLYGNI